MTIGFTVREPILADGQVDAITGFSFSSYFTLKDSGVPLDDIIVMLMGDYGLKLYSNAIIVNAKFAAENPEAVRGFLRAFLKGVSPAVVGMIPPSSATPVQFTDQSSIGNCFL